MTRSLLAWLALSGVLAGVISFDASAQRRPRDQDEAFAARQSGQVMSLHQIEKKVIPQMEGADYLGPEFDASSGVYRLKFMRRGSVLWIDVDGRTGAIVGRSGY